MPIATAPRIVVVRHGETAWSAVFRHTGRTDVPLNAAGRRGAAELASSLAGEKFDRVWCSPLLRARETCDLAGFGERAELCDDLQEWDYGDYEGLTAVQIREHSPGWNLWRDGCPGGESLADISARADRALATMTRAEPATVLAFAHGHILRVLAARWLEMEPAAGARFALTPAHIGVLGYERETRVLVRWNGLVP